MAIPRSRVRAKDRLIWAYTPRGLFTETVRIRWPYPYPPMQAHARHQMRLTILTTGAPSGVFSLPNKIKTFAWKASRNILPTKTDLCHRGVLDEALCEACGLSEETSGHLFWDCTVAREIWEASGLPLDVRGIRYREFIDLIWHLIFVQLGRLKL